MWRVSHNKIEQVSKEEIVEFVHSQDVLGFDIETTMLNYLKDDIVAISFGTEAVQYVVSSDLEDIMSTVLYNVEVVIHNAMFDLCFGCYKYNIPVSQVAVKDTFRLKCVTSNGIKQQKGLKALLKQYLNVDVDKTEQTTFRDHNLTDEQILYSANDVKYLIPLYNELYAEAVELFKVGALTADTIDRENAIVATMAEVTTKGVPYNIEKHLELIKKWEAEERTLLINLSSKLSKPVNFNSPKQLVELFNSYDTALNKSSKAALDNYLMSGSNEQLKELIRELQEYRKCSKKLTTYGKKFLASVHTDNKIRTQISMNTTTGRFSSADVTEIVGVTKKGTPKRRKANQFVNLQNIPANEMKECFAAEEGYEIVTADLDGCELRILADQSKDPLLLKTLNEGFDMHTELATASYRIIYDDPEFVIDKKLRTKHKPVIFGMFYGAKPERIKQIMNIPRPVAKKVWQSVRDKLPVAFDFLDNYVKTSLRNGFAVANDVSRSAYFLDEYMDYERNGQEHPQLYRIVKRLYNYPMQATNADMIKEAIINVHKFFQYSGNGRLLMSVYDELVYTRPKDCKYIDDQVYRIIKSSCEKFLSNVEMKISFNVENFWSK